MNWGIDFTTQAQEDLVGLDGELADSITETLVAWLADGPPRQNERTVAGIRFYESVIADRVLVGYTVKADPPTFALLWVRTRPGRPPMTGP